MGKEGRIARWIQRSKIKISPHGLSTGLAPWNIEIGSSALNWVQHRLDEARIQGGVILVARSGSRPAISIFERCRACGWPRRSKRVRSRRASSGHPPPKGKAREVPLGSGRWIEEEAMNFFGPMDMVDRTIQNMVSILQYLVPLGGFEKGSFF